MWFIGVEVEQETSAPPPKEILDPPLSRIGLLLTVTDDSMTCAVVIFRVKVSCITSVDGIINSALT